MPPIRYNKNELGVFQNGADCAVTERKFLLCMTITTMCIRTRMTTTITTTSAIMTIITIMSAMKAATITTASIAARTPRLN